jgi:sugar lactone lactonase YvrE
MPIRTALRATRRLAPMLALLPLAACSTAPKADATPPRARVVAESDLQWTGVAVDESGRVFVNYPNWSDRYVQAVAEIIELPGGARVESPYPDARWNVWTEGQTAWRDSFVAVQSVHIDRQNRLWVLDTGRVSRAAGRQACVYEIDLAHDQVRRVLPVPFEVAPEGSYLNDIRLTPDGRHAFISESGLGAIIVLDVEAGTFRRTLADHPSTKGSAAKTPVVGGRPWVRRESGEPLVVHCDGIAVSPDARWVYYQAISENTLYRVPADALIRPGLDHAGSVERVGTAPVTDGMIFDDDGNLYFSALEENAIIYRTPAGEFVTLASDPAINWPDSFAIHRPTGTLYFTTAQIHLTPDFSPDGSWPTDPFRVWSIPLPE